MEKPRPTPMRTSRLFALLTSTVLGLSSFATPARAEETGDRVVTTGPKPSLLRTGALTLGLAYVPAAVVGVTSPLPEDRLLLAPVAGPWLDLGERKCDDCSNEKLNQVLLVTDGVVQGIGALEIVGAFLLWETREQRAQRVQSQKRAFRLRFMPERIAGGYGLRATGEF
jgi:hypothetical protein